MAVRVTRAEAVGDPRLTAQFDIELVGCSAHARRPSAQYADQDPKRAAEVLGLFEMLAVHEVALERHGRNQENTLAVGGVDSRNAARAWLGAHPARQ